MSYVKLAFAFQVWRSVTVILNAARLKVCQLSVRSHLDHVDFITDSSDCDMLCMAARIEKFVRRSIAPKALIFLFAQDLLDLIFLSIEQKSVFLFSTAYAVLAVPTVVATVDCNCMVINKSHSRVFSFRERSACQDHRPLRVFADSQALNWVDEAIVAESTENVDFVAEAARAVAFPLMVECWGIVAPFRLLDIEELHYFYTPIRRCIFTPS